MYVVKNRSGRPVATFVHFSDLRQFEQQNLGRGYETEDRPELDEQLAQLMASKPVDETWRKGSSG